MIQVEFIIITLTISIYFILFTFIIWTILNENRGNEDFVLNRVADWLKNHATSEI